MVRCSHDDCGWQAIAPSEDAAWDQYAEHLLAEHSRQVAADVPEGMVQVKLDRDGDWLTVTVEEAHELHDAAHDD